MRAQKRGPRDMSGSSLSFTRVEIPLTESPAIDLEEIAHESAFVVDRARILPG